MSDPTPRGRGRLFAVAALGVTAGLLLTPLPPGWLGPHQGILLDFGHVPLFAALVIALRYGLGRPLWKPLAAAVVLAGLAEVVQPWTGRSGDWLDFLRGVLGALAGASLVRAWEAQRYWVWAAGYVGVAALLVAGPVVEVAPYAADTAAGEREFPVLAGFAADREHLRWECKQATLELRPEERVGRLEFLPGPEIYPSAILRPITTDFRGYARLCCEFRVADEPIELVISVRTGTGSWDGPTTHAQVGRAYPVGRAVARLDLGELSARAEPPPLDLADVRAVQFFVVRPAHPQVIELSGIWLER